MKNFFSLLMILSAAFTTQANTVLNDPTSETGIEIYTASESSELNIEVDEKLTGTSVTVSVFNSVGEIVLESNLGLGLNKIDVQQLAKGDYVAVVRENGEYTSKQSFVIG